MAQEEGQQTISEITCQEIAQWASAYLDEQIGDECKRRIVLHLAICAGCETYVKQIAVVRDLVALLPKAVEEPTNAERLRQAFAARAHRTPS